MCPPHFYTVIKTRRPPTPPYPPPLLFPRICWVKQIICFSQTLVIVSDCRGNEWNLAKMNRLLSFVCFVFLAYQAVIIFYYLFCLRGTAVSLSPPSIRLLIPVQYTAVLEKTSYLGLVLRRAAQRLQICSILPYFPVCTDHRLPRAHANVAIVGQI